jgi:cytidine deaminase
MMEKVIKINFQEFSSLQELDKADQELLDLALRASETSYSPYSLFQVGAAVRLANGETLSGSNQENAAYPSGLCAERVVLFYAQARYPDIPVETIAIFARSKEFNLDSPVTPCGPCRQVMAEHETRHQHKIKVIMGGDHGHVITTTGMDNLLPLMFMQEKLKKK